MTVKSDAKIGNNAAKAKDNLKRRKTQRHRNINEAIETSNWRVIGNKSLSVPRKIIKKSKKEDL